MRAATDTDGGHPRAGRATSARAAVVLALAAAAALAVTQSGAESARTASVSAKLGSQTIQANRTVAVNGSVRGLGAHPQVTLQRRAGHFWKQAAGPTTASRHGGSYRLRWQPSRVGTARLRVRATGSGRSAASRTFRLSVTPTATTTSAGGYGAGNWPPASWRPFASSSPFYQPLPTNPRLVGNSAAMVSRLFSLAQSTAPPVIQVSTRGKQGGTPTYFSQPTDPLFTINCTRSWGGCGVDGVKVRIPAGARPEGGVASNGTDKGTDSHMTIIDQAAGYAYDVWQVQESRIPSSGGTLNVSYGGRFPLSGDGVGGGGASNAAGFSDIIGRPRIEAIRAGEIPHAITVVINCDNGKAVYPGSPKGVGTTCSNPANAPPMGSRFQLDYSDAEIDALNAPEHRKVIYRAMAHYGLIVGDTESDRLFSLELDSDYTYNSFGAPSPWLNFAKSSSGWAFNGGEYSSDLGADGVDYHRLRVIAPCVSQRNC